MKTKNSRRDFVKKSAFVVGATSLGFSCNNTENEEVKAVNESKETIKPTIIATWKNLGATAAAMEMMKKTGSALDAVEAGAKVPEADPNDTSVGYGGNPDANGIVSLDACIMDHEGNAGSVVFLQGIKHPISVARKVMEETPHVILSGQGALDFALGKGFEVENLLTPEAESRWLEWKETNQSIPVGKDNHDTIGILALNEKGELCGACTTSGSAYKMHGRVGDSPIIGAGMYVDNEVGGACATGLGELVLTTLGSFLIVELMRQGASPTEACKEAIGRIVKRYKNRIDEDSWQVGYLALDKYGNYGQYSIKEGFSVAVNQGGENKEVKSDSFFS